MRKKVMAFNAKVNAWIMKRLKGVWLDPIFCGIFAAMALFSAVGGLHLQKDKLFYSAFIWALAALMCLRRVRKIRAHEKEEQKNQTMEEK